MTPKGQSQKDARMRREGYSDGYDLLAPLRLDAAYQGGWRNGRKARMDDEAYEREQQAQYPRGAS